MMKRVDSSASEMQDLAETAEGMKIYNVSKSRFTFMYPEIYSLTTTFISIQNTGNLQLPYK